MNSGLSPSDPVLVAAFRSALLHQGAIALIMIVLLWVIWATARTRRRATPGPASGTAAPGMAEPRGRWLLRGGGAGPVRLVGLGGLVSYLTGHWSLDPFLVVVL